MREKDLRGGAIAQLIQRCVTLSLTAPYSPFPTPHSRSPAPLVAKF
ncbi:hypothetical protein H6G89_24235 [Oscillatoria sp. FACHB-1407]|nr:hypothetical protein [Oscillatoria sp. FACHB-1407]MBD2464114.1 hypothetical protein [Oscillatoria sp. FACHB-1407]